MSLAGTILLEKNYVQVGVRQNLEFVWSSAQAPSKEFLNELQIQTSHNPALWNFYYSQKEFKSQQHQTQFINRLKIPFVLLRKPAAWPQFYLSSVGEQLGFLPPQGEILSNFTSASEKKAHSLNYIMPHHRFDWGLFGLCFFSILIGLILIFYHRKIYRKLRQIHFRIAKEENIREIWEEKISNFLENSKKKPTQAKSFYLELLKEWNLEFFKKDHDEIILSELKKRFFKKMIVEKRLGLDRKKDYAMRLNTWENMSQELLFSENPQMNLNPIKDFLLFHIEFWE